MNERGPRETFDELSRLYSPCAAMLAGPRINSSFVEPKWQAWAEQLSFEFRNGLSPAFLRSSIVSQTMFQGDAEVCDAELAFLRKHYADRARLLEVIGELDLGDPVTMLIDGTISSTNVVHHAYHLARYEHATKRSIFGMRRVAEWGGGYGNMCKVFVRQNPGVESYVIFDLPQLSAVQWVYLSSCFGEAAVNLISPYNRTCRDGAINLVPVNLLDRVYGAEGFDFFISNWALSESTPDAQAYASSIGLLDCPNLLVSLHQCGDHVPFMSQSTGLRQMLETRGVEMEPVEVIPGTNFYAFR